MVHSYEHRLGVLENLNVGPVGSLNRGNNLALNPDKLNLISRFLHDGKKHSKLSFDLSKR